VGGALVRFDDSLARVKIGGGAQHPLVDEIWSSEIFSFEKCA